MKNRFEEFAALHKNTEPLLIGNVWSVQSAKVFEKQKFKAIGTSSASVAETLGYEDGQEMSLEEYLFVVKRITASTSIPLTVDFEAGYGTTAEEISNNITQLYDAGVSGINIEDSTVVNGKRTIENPNVFAEKLQQIIKRLNADNIRMFINVRSDSFILGLAHALEDTLSRIALYENTGAHGIFLPCISKITDIEKVTGRSTLPINVMCIPGLPDFKQLHKAGVKRISMGPFVNKNLYKKLEASIEKITQDGNFNSIF